MHNPILAILGAAVAGWVFGAIWYTALGKAYQRALGLDTEACKGQKMPLTPMVTSFVVALVMSAVMYQLLSNLGVLGVQPAALAGITIGVGFLGCSVLVNNLFQKKPFTLTLIDGGHWALAVTVEAVVLSFLA
jgi:hypothetical protein